MKLARLDNRRALSARRLALALTVAALVPLLLYAGIPSWWSERGVLLENATADDYAPVNQGQLKNIAKAAVAEMDTKLSGGAGHELHGLIESWSSSNPAPNDFAPVNLGQLKNVARLFFNRLISAGLVDHYPWESSLNAADDFAVANIGQVKNLFAFDLPTTNFLQDPLADRITAGEHSANLALQSNAVWSWSSNSGLTPDFARSYPRRVPGLSGIRSVSSGDRHLVALSVDGRVFTWGENNAGQLGDGTSAQRDAPAALPDMTSIVSVKAGAYYTLALRQDGTVFAWGDNAYGQLGDGSTTPSLVPKLITGLEGVRKVAAGYSRSVALANDGTVWTWGYDRYAGGDIFHVNPTAIPDLTLVVDIAAGYEHTLAVKADGSVWAWGANYYNQIGHGSSSGIFQDIPVQVSNLTDVIKVASSAFHSLALASDGTVWAWGYNFDGQLGDGTTERRLAPVKVTGLTGVIAIATASSYSLAMKADGTVWTWGEGATGILPGANRHVPQQVALGLLDPNQNGMDDRWELNFFGNLDQAGDADFDGDGISNRQEFLRGTDPIDYFNGVTPIIEIASGNNQVGDAGKFLSKPLKVLVRNPAGQLLVNAPVTFSILNGAGALASTLGGSQQQSLLLRTDTKGEAGAYHALPDAAGTSTRTIVRAGQLAAPASVTFRGIVRFELPSPSPSPSPPPDGSPTPTPSPTATPIAPYRYAIIDLGKDMYPLRLNNQGHILVQGYDANTQWSNFRWRGGVLEKLTYGGPHTFFDAQDINDSGAVVGYLRNQTVWKFNAENEIQAGLFWPADNSNGIKISAPLAFRTFEPIKPGSIRQASLTAISNAHGLFGMACTGTVRGFLNRTIAITNSEMWPSGSLPTQLSDATAINNPVDSFTSNWQGSSDTIFRANSNGHYIGRKFTPFATSQGFLQGTETGMVDGKSVSFDPTDINEAGIVVGNSAPGGSIVIRTPRPSPSPPATPVPGTPEFTDKIIDGASPLAINDHVHPLSSPAPQSSPIPSSSPHSSPSPSPSPSPNPAPQILGWAGNALVVWERQEDGHTWHPFGLEEMIPSMDGWQYLEPYDMNDTGAIVGTGWYTDPSIPGAQGEYHAFLLVPVELTVDANRDGVIDDKDGGKVTAEKPWHFWINDDNDAGAVDGDDIPGLANSDAKDAGLGTFRVDGVRDLVDFFPLYLDLKQIVALMPPAQFSYFLKQEQGALNFTYTELKPGDGKNERAGAYLKDLDAAQQLQSAEAFQITAAGVQLTTAFLNKIKDEGKGVILIEGRSATDKPLVLEVRKGSKKIAELAFQVKIDGVEQMFRHKNLLAAGGGSGGPADRLEEPTNYPDYLTTNNSFVMVHGYNVNPESARGWGAEMFKRLHWTGSNAKFYNVTWYGSETQIGGSLTTDYQANVDNAFATAQQFTSFLGGLINPTVAAHSLGNMLVGSAIQDWGARPSNYFMIDAAVAKESYDETEEQLSDGGVIGMEHPEWSAYNRRLWSSDWHLLFAAVDNRSTLTWQNRLENVDSVPAYNFYSTGEEVLKNPSLSPGLPLSADEVWNNQERMKGRMLTGQVLSSNYGGWAFSNFWDVRDTNVEPDLVYRRKFPNETSAITDVQLRTNPFFRPGPTELYGTNGSDYASPQQRRNTLLAEMIPALSFAAGSNRLQSFGRERNFDMPSIYAEGWPPERGGDTKWFHSDVKVVAYTYIYRLYEQFVALGELDQ